MKLLSWNCQGIGNPKTVRAFNKLLSDTKPDVFFIMETKLVANNNGLLTRLRNRYQIHHVDCSTTGGGRAGGLLMGWNSCIIDVSLINACSNYIDVQIKSNNILWRATGIYGFPQNQNKFLTCNLIEELAEVTQHQNWLLFGDFNIILSNEEKMGGNAYDQRIMHRFRNAINNCNLQDLGYNGEIFTWNNRQEDHHHIRARLDRFLAYEGWCTAFPVHKNDHLMRYGSDHCPMLLVYDANPACRKIQRQSRGKKYEILWTRHENHVKIVKETWQQTYGNLPKKLALTLDNLHSRGHIQFGSIPKEIKKVQNELSQLNNSSDTRGMIQQIHDKEKELDTLLENEELWWSQCSRALWLQHGDMNTKFFHQKASQRRQRNKIDTIIDNNGVTHSDPQLIEDTLINHFKTLFTSQTTHNSNQATEVVKESMKPDM
jgi:exonuclease III